MADKTPAPAPDPAPAPAKATRVLLATPDYLTVFQVGDLEFTHLGTEVAAAHANDLVEVAARHGVRLVDITPADKD